MQSRQTRLRAQARADDTRARLVQRHLARYAPDVRARICAAAGRHPRLADLAVTFPGLLFALAVRGVDVEQARAHVVAGRPLRDAAEAARVPMWLRKLPPDRCPDGRQFDRETFERSAKLVAFPNSPALPLVIGQAPESARSDTHDTKS
jgi:hypothetical protein